MPNYRYDFESRIDALFCAREMPLDELCAHIGRLAETVKVTSEAGLCSMRGAIRRFKQLAAQLNRPPWCLSCESLTWLTDNMRWVEVHARECADYRAQLPGVSGVPRIEIIAREYALSCSCNVSQDGIERVLATFDLGAPLNMREIWAFLVAIKAVLCRTFSLAAMLTMEDCLAGAEAEAWFESDAVLPKDASDAFYVHAARISRDAETPDRIDFVNSAQVDIDALIRRESARLSVVRMWIIRCVESLRALDSCDMAAVFASVSRVDRTLMRDPADIYPRMTVQTRAAYRKEVERIAKCCGVAEHVVASVALERATNALSAARHIGWWVYAREGQAQLISALNKLPHTGISPRYFDHALRVCATAGGIAAVAFGAPMALSALLIPGLITASAAVIKRVLSNSLPTRPLPELHFGSIPNEYRTLVVTPTLLTGPDAAREQMHKLHILSALKADSNVDFALLGDFADADSQFQPSDENIWRAGSVATRALNETAGCERFFYLQRERTFAKSECKWMGFERKRGALSALNDLLLGGDNAFTRITCTPKALAHRYKYVITLDSDTRIMPGDIERLIGKIAHPLNADYALIQPRMSQIASSARTPFARLYGGEGGVDTYHSCGSDFYQDAFSEGSFCGKGIYDVSAFYAKAQSRLPQGAILSHDLIEGCLAGCGYAGDIVAYDAHPLRFAGWLKRQHRWVRGDWQLAPLLIDKNLPLSPVSRRKIANNLWRSLAVPVGLIAALCGMIAGSPALTAFGLLPIYLPMLINPASLKDQSAWMALAARLSFLPREAISTLDAIVRTIVRAFITRKNMLEWMTAAQAESMTESGGRLINLLCAVISIFPFSQMHKRPVFALMSALLSALWLFSGATQKRLGREYPAQTFLSDDKDMLTALARDTWRYFDKHVPLNGNGLPPDNVQTSPDIGAARRTSPTNIGLYMLSCVSAHKMNFISEDECIRRITGTVDSLMRLKKWHGHVFNWIDIDDLSPLNPVYVSSVDSGNLAACCLCCAEVLREMNRHVPAERLNTLVENMDFRPLYNEKRKLFHIGMDISSMRLGDSYYDLLASESRLLSYVSMMKGDANIDHWSHLGRTIVDSCAGNCLASWSGTLFEYLMPQLLLPTYPSTLIGDSCVRAINAQKLHNRHLPWGVSECGYCAFDARMNYQYAAFGIPELALKGNVGSDVIAPYASALALPIDPAAVGNIRKMLTRGWADECGLFEAVDTNRARTAKEAIIHSHMTHHQGMILCALTNALNGNALSETFMRIPRAAALNLLLMERMPKNRALPIRRSHCDAQSHPRERDTARRLIENIHMLSGAGMHLLCDARGIRRAMHGDTLINRWCANPYDSGRGFELYINDSDAFLGAQAICDVGSVTYMREDESLAYEIYISVSSETGAAYQTLRILNKRETPAHVEILSRFEVAFAQCDAWESHPAFEGLFVHSEWSKNGFIFTRRERKLKSNHAPNALIFAAWGGEITGYDSDRTQNQLSGTMGDVIDPCAAIRQAAVVPPHERIELGFAMGVTPRNFAQNFMDECAHKRTASRAMRLNECSRASTLRDFGLTRRQYYAMMAAAFPLIYAYPRAGTTAPDIAALWSVGISGTMMPLVFAHVDTLDDLHIARRALKAYALWRAYGLKCELAVVYLGGGQYHQPLRDALTNLARAISPNIVNDVRLLDRTTLPAHTLSALNSACAIEVNRGFAHTPDLSSNPKQLSAVTFTAPPVPPVLADNGYGGFVGDEYVIYARPPAPWVNMLATGRIGAIISQRGGGYAWLNNSRMARITAWTCDPQNEGFAAQRTIIHDLDSGAIYDPLFGQNLVKHGAGYSRFIGSVDGIDHEITAFADASAPLLCRIIRLKNIGDRPRRISIACNMHAILGSSPNDARNVRIEQIGGDTIARSPAISAVFSTYRGNGREVIIQPGDEYQSHWLIGEGSPEEYDSSAGLSRAKAFWDERLSIMCIDTGDMLRDVFVNRWLPYQVQTSRIWGRTGYYQSGGAFGFRDQLQDMLSLLMTDPEQVREHILLCAGHQFEAGDVQHWWHPPAHGVRTRITDDMLFLPYVTHEYVKTTGDTGILDEVIPYLKDEPIPENVEDWYGAAQVSQETGTLEEHCMRAIRRSMAFGEHGLMLMGMGDWNDAMNAIGADGKGESVWLSMFASVTLKQFAGISRHTDELLAMRVRLINAIEEHAWDGQWYRRAFYGDGYAIGSKNSAACKIDALSQCWAVFAELNPDRSRAAMDALWEQLVDRESGIVKLLTPPFDDGHRFSGYISAYPPGVRENGGQYTHAAAWAIIAYAHLGDAARAWQLFDLLMPYNRDADTYRLEPYVMAGDVYGGAHNGRGGWSWYTGSAAWMWRAMVHAMLGVTKIGRSMYINALLPPDKDEISFTYKFGCATFRLISRRGAANASPIVLIDDGITHEYVFPARY